MEQEDIEEFEDGLQNAIVDGLDYNNIESLLPMDWEVRTYYHDGNFVCLDVKDADIDWRVVDFEVDEFYNIWQKTFDRYGLQLVSCGRSGGYLGFKLQDFLECGIVINEDEVPNALKTVQPELGLEDDEYDDDNEYFNAGYEYPFEDDRRIPSIFKIDDDLRKDMENFQLDAENTRAQWKEDYQDEFFADEKEDDDYYYDPDDDEDVE